jgi:polyphosphate kinase 2 (PPK2 family)
VADATERTFWSSYMAAYEDMLEHTSTKHAPWYVVPADNKWFTRLAVAGILWQTLADLELEFPKVTKAKVQELQEVRRMLMAEEN